MTLFKWNLDLAPSCCCISRLFLKQFLFCAAAAAILLTTFNFFMLWDLAKAIDWYWSAAAFMSFLMWRMICCELSWFVFRSASWLVFVYPIFLAKGIMCFEKYDFDLPCNAILFLRSSICEDKFLANSFVDKCFFSFLDWLCNSLARAFAATRFAKCKCFRFRSLLAITAAFILPWKKAARVLAFDIIVLDSRLVMTIGRSSLNMCSNLFL